MGYQSRNRKYLTPREKNARTRWHALRLIIFLLLGGLLWIFKNRQSYWAWLETFFY
jgi:uncharacterized membrane protein YccC